MLLLFCLIYESVQGSRNDKELVGKIWTILILIKIGKLNIPHSHRSVVHGGVKWLASVANHSMTITIEFFKAKKKEKQLWGLP